MVNVDELVDKLRSGAVEPVDVAGEPILCVQVFETKRSQAELYLLRSGQKIPAHHHSAIDDVFMGVSGHGQVRTWDAAGDPVDHEVVAGSVVVVEPGTPHEVSCQGDEFSYILTQSPKELYDLHPHKGGAT